MIKKLFKINNSDLKNKNYFLDSDFNKYYFDAVKCNNVTYFENNPLSKDQVISKTRIMEYEGNNIELETDDNEYQKCKNNSF